MLRAQYQRRGPVPQDVIEAVEFEVSRLQVGQALVEVVAAPINPADVLTLTGEYGQLPPLPAIGGREGVGRVSELGSETGGVRVGQLVLLPLGCGSWSTHVVTDAAQLRPLPDEADPLQLSMMAITPPTAALLLSECVTLGSGDWVIQNAANSAVGLYLVQLARYRGYRTVNVVRRQDAAAVVRDTGGVVLVDGEDLAERVVEATGGAAVRLGIDAVSGAATGRLADCLCESATLVSYGRMSGEPCAVQPDAFVFRDPTLRGFWLVNWFRRTPEEQRRTLVDELARLITQGRSTRRSTLPTTSARSKKQWQAPPAEIDRERSSLSRDGELTPEGVRISSQSCPCPREHDCRSTTRVTGAPPNSPISRLDMLFADR
jgi:mitochondrial enoyl-[acyl-carrier protein] reductase / trans-2-enoyl-CoA reductase